MLEGVTSGLCKTNLCPSNPESITLLHWKNIGFFLYCSWINQKRCSESSGSKLHKLCVAPSSIWINLFSEICVLNLDNHTSLLYKYCRKCRIQILCGVQCKNKWTDDSSLTQSMASKNRKNLSWVWKWLLMVPDKLFFLSPSGNQVNGVENHQKEVVFTIYAIGQEISSGFRKLHMLPRWVYMFSQWYPILYRCWNMSAMEID